MWNVLASYGITGKLLAIIQSRYREAVCSVNHRGQLGLAVTFPLLTPF